MKKNILEKKGNKEKISLFKVFNPPNLNTKIVKVLKSGQLSEGKQVKIFNSKIVKYINNQNIVLFNSCTSALTAAYQLAGIKKNSEVITTPLTCVAANMPLLHIGAKIIWSDVNPKTGMIDINDLSNKISKKTKAIIVLHKDGEPFDVNILRKIIKKKKLKTKIIEDAAHAFGAKLRGLKIGNHGDFVAFSFQAIKQIHTCDGGALVCKSKKDFKEAKKIKWLGIDRDLKKSGKNIWLNDIKSLGYKSNLNNLLASIGIEQMKYVKGILKKNNKNGKYLDKELSKIKGIKILKRDKKSFSTYWAYSFLSKDKKKIEKNLNENNIETFQIHPRNDNYTIFKKFKIKLPNLDKFSKEEINIPCGWWLNKVQLNKIIKVIKKTYEKN